MEDAQAAMKNECLQIADADSVKEARDNGMEVHINDSSASCYNPDTNDIFYYEIRKMSDVGLL